MKALVTGHRGFLGRHFHRALDTRGYDVYGVDKREGPRTNFDPWEPRDCRGIFDSLQTYDLVIHCAAVIGGRAKIEGDPLALAENLELDAALFRWAARVRPGRVVYISSSAVYPVHLQQDAARRERPRGLAENMQEPLRSRACLGVPDRTYGWSKLAGEALAGELRRLGVPVTVVRPFSGYGADQDEDYPFRAFLERARRRDDPFVIWGSGQQVRDFVHVDDVVAATLTAAVSGVSGPLNICTGQPTSLYHLASMFCAVADYMPEFEPQYDAPRGVQMRVGDPREMLKVYRPKIDLRDAIVKALA